MDHHLLSAVLWTGSDFLQDAARHPGAPAVVIVALGLSFAGLGVWLVNRKKAPGEKPPAR